MERPWDGVSGLVALGLLGFLLGLVIRQGSRLSLLEKDLKYLKDRLAALTAAAPATADKVLVAEPDSAARSEESPPVRRDLSYEETLGYAATNISPSLEPLGESSAEPGAEMEAPGAGDFTFEAEPTPTRPAPPPLPAQSPNRMDDLLDKARSFLTTANVVLGSGIIILFFGVSFLLKYAVEHDLLPLELRYIGAALLGIVLMAIGWRLRFKRRSYALLLQGRRRGYLIYYCFFRGQMARFGPSFPGLFPDGGPGNPVRPAIRSGRCPGPVRLRGRGRVSGPGGGGGGGGCSPPPVAATMSCSSAITPCSAPGYWGWPFSKPGGNST